MNENDKGPLGYTVRQWRIFTLVLLVGLAGVFFQVLRHQNIDHSAALYIGLPLLLALGLSLSPKTKSTVGSTMKGLTIALLLSAPVFLEGFICILFASPVLYSIAALVAWQVGRAKARRDSNSKIQLSAISIVLAFASLEGTQKTLSFERYRQVEYSRVVNIDMKTIRKNLSLSSIPNSKRPFFLKIFPLPVNITGKGLDVGDQRKLDFVYNKWFFTNIHRGSTVFRIIESTENRIRFNIPHDDSYISNYLTWKHSEVFLEPMGAGKTRVTWKLGFNRRLDPIWYFGPMQTYAAWLTAKVLVDNVVSSSI